MTSLVTVDEWSEPGVLDRVDLHRRSTEWVANLWRQEDTLLLKVDVHGRFTTNPDGTRLRLVRPFVEFDDQRHILLGQYEERAIFVVEALVDGPVHALRQVGGTLSRTEREIATQACSVTNWHRSEPRCSFCGTETRRIRGGLGRHCDTCDKEVFLRTDPAVIVAVLDPEDRLLLAGQRTWDTGRVSILAGFVEGGESLEQACHREIAEESDVSLASVHYFGSQPWPMPRSLMVGFFARAASTEISVDGEELTYGDWFSRDRVRAEVADGTLRLPGPASIAHRMINAWLDGYAPR